LLRVLAVFGLFAAAVRYVVAPLGFWRAAENCERPQHEVVMVMEIPDDEKPGKTLKVEFRRYEPYLVAEVELPAGLSEAERRSTGFQQVAGYIFGGNGRRRPGFLGKWLPARLAASKEVEKISMTAPVRTETAGENLISYEPLREEDAEIRGISFTMPSKYKSVSDLPIPLNRNVTLREVPEHFAAAVGFRGPPPSPERVLVVKQAILRLLEEQNVELVKKQGTMVYQYHDPFATPNMLRWNEVVVMIKDLPDED